eukprot:281463-Pelagomonas_calceolata.AAC.1
MGNNDHLCGPIAIQACTRTLERTRVHKAHLVSLLDLEAEVVGRGQRGSGRPSHALRPSPLKARHLRLKSERGKRDNEQKQRWDQSGGWGQMKSMDG